MSPVPPATSRMRWAEGGEGVGEDGEDEKDDEIEEEKPGLREETKWSFHIRCQPKDMRSFMRSYDSATLWKTLATRSVLSASVTPSSKPKCVVREGGGGGGAALFEAPGTGGDDGVGVGMEAEGDAGRRMAGDAENVRRQDNRAVVRRAADRRSGLAAADMAMLGCDVVLVLLDAE